MYVEYYGLREEPFGVTPDPRYLYLSKMHAEAQASLIYGIESNRGFLALIAPPGTGKTTLLFNLLERFRTTAHTAFIFQTVCNSDEFFTYLMNELGVRTAGRNRAELHLLFNDMLVQAASKRKGFLILIDEAQNLGADVLESLRLLSNFEMPRAKLLQIVVAGQPGFADKLMRNDLRQFRQRLGAVVQLHALTPAEASAYIDHRLRTAGYNGPNLFTRNARELLIDQSKGIPRLINIFCFNALSLGYALRSRVINEAMVQEVVEDGALNEVSLDSPLPVIAKQPPKNELHPESQLNGRDTSDGSKAEDGSSIRVGMTHPSGGGVGIGDTRPGANQLVGGLLRRRHSFLLSLTIFLCVIAGGGPIMRRSTAKTSHINASHRDQGAISAATPASDNAKGSATESPLATTEVLSTSDSPGRNTSNPNESITETELLRASALEYPLDAQRLKHEGIVVLIATIAPDGRVRDVERISGDSMLADAALRSVRTWQYRPASVNGRPVGTRARIVLKFSLHGKS